MEERVLEVFDDLGNVNGARISVRLVERRGQLLLDVRKVRNGAFMPQGIELTSDMLTRLLAQGPAVIAKLKQPAPKASQSQPASPQLTRKRPARPTPEA